MWETSVSNSFINLLKSLDMNYYKKKYEKKITIQNTKCNSDFVCAYVNTEMYFNLTLSAPSRFSAGGGKKKKKI